MELAALGLWIATIMGGLYMFGLLLRTGNTHSGATDTHLPTTAVFAHGSLAVFGLGGWALYMGYRNDVLGWSVLATVVAVALGGGLLFLRWHKDRKATGPHSEAVKARLAEQQIPSPVVHLHGALATFTIVAVVLALLGIG